ncbi:MAG: hypothetical protein HC903_14420 [Methylacidiphilales bacterium]|nr:hypothetical protein [Candidatus Methylacidiphilales bacterium]NJR19235.1 hypothetical protein [Calothrix sp. CSU_2_0]
MADNTNFIKIWELGIGNWGLGIGDWALGIGHCTQTGKGFRVNSLVWSMSLT